MNASGLRTAKAKPLTPLYHFKLRGPDAPAESISAEFPTVAAAVYQAVKSGQEMIAEAMAQSKTVGVDTIDILDETATMVASVAMWDLLPDDMRHGGS